MLSLGAESSALRSFNVNYNQIRVTWLLPIPLVLDVGILPGMDVPRNLRPIRLSRRTAPFDSDDYIFELKIDGFRSLAYIENGQCDLVSRNGNTFRNFELPWTSQCA